MEQTYVQFEREKSDIRVGDNCPGGERQMSRWGEEKSGWSEICPGLDNCSGGWQVSKRCRTTSSWVEQMFRTNHQWVGQLSLLWVEQVSRLDSYAGGADILIFFNKAGQGGLDRNCLRPEYQRRNWSLHCFHFRGTSKTGHWCCVFSLHLAKYKWDCRCNCGRGQLYHLLQMRFPLKIATSTEPQMWFIIITFGSTAVSDYLFIMEC